MRQTLVVMLVLLTLGCSRPATVGSGSSPSAARDDRIVSADQLIAAMHDRYEGKWYRTLTFIQKSTYLRTDGSTLREETWYEAGAMPGRLRIDLGEPSRGMGVLYRGDSVYQIQSGRVTDRRVGRNLLMILGFDVYAQSTARTLEQLRAERINVDVLRRDTLYGRSVYVVGAGPTDSTTNQFWVDADRLLFVRLIQSDAQGRRTQDIRFEKYVQHGGGWVAEDVRVLSGGRMIFHEEYSNVRVNVALDDDLFIPERWSAARHWYQP
jgi:hypothetical protein